MKSDSLDLLEKSQLPPAQARAILKVMESELATHDSALASKSDVHGVELKLEGLRTEMQVLRTEMQTLRAELIGEIKGTVRWNFGFWVAQLGAMAAILKLLK